MKNPTQNEAKEQLLNKVNHPIPSTDQRWLSISDFTTLFGFSKSTQQRLRKHNSLPYSKVRNAIRYDRFKIDEFFSDHEVSA